MGDCCKKDFDCDRGFFGGDSFIWIIIIIVILLCFCPGIFDGRGGCGKCDHDPCC